VILNGPPPTMAARGRLTISAPTGAWTARALRDKLPYHRGGTAVR
jgi:hypothetical protein